MNSIGEKLRQQRLQRGESIEKIAEATRINPRHLEAIESGDYGKIPGKFFARSFLRQYATYLGLDEAEVEGELRNLAEPDAAPTVAPAEAERYSVPRVKASVPSGRRVGPSLIAFVLMIVACAFIYALWLRTERPAETVPAAEQSAKQPPAQEANPETQQGSAAGAGAGKKATSEAVQAPPPAAAPAAVPPSEGVLVEVKATEAAWLRVTADDQVVLTSTLKPEETRRFEAKQYVRIYTGNAGGLEVQHQGKGLGRLGTSGQVATAVFAREEHKITPFIPASRRAAPEPPPE